MYFIASTIWKILVAGHIPHPSPAASPFPIFNNQATLNFTEYSNPQYKICKQGVSFSAPGRHPGVTVVHDDKCRPPAMTNTMLMTKNKTYYKDNVDDEYTILNDNHPGVNTNEMSTL